MALSFLDASDPLATALTTALQTGDTPALAALLTAHPHLTTIHIGTSSEARTPLHILADHPGHRAHCAASATALVRAGADVNAHFVGFHAETPLHWAASNNDVELLDALLDLGADIEARGGVIGDGTPLSDARVFVQLGAARRLVERGARVTVCDAAILGLVGELRGFFDGGGVGKKTPDKEETDVALWNACRGGQLEAAKFLIEKRADVDVAPPWGGGSPLDAARAGGQDGCAEVVVWLTDMGAKSAAGETDHRTST